MPSKAEFYRQMAEQVSTRLVGSWKEWTAFLTTAARLYKYPFHEQMMIYAQRPDATACAEYDLWNEKMGRYVRRGSKGIALVDDSGDRPRLRYVFDISDTGTREHSRTPWLWQLEEQHIGPVSAMLECNYGVAGDDLAQQLTDVAGKLASEYWDEHQQDFRYIVDGSFLEEYDDLNIEVQFKSAATVSIAYALMSRCGLDTEQYFQHEDFMPIFDFNTPATVGALGAAVSQINQQVLRQIGVTIQNYERKQLAERSNHHEEQPDLHAERGLSDSRPEADRTAVEAPGQVRQDAESVPEGTPAPDLQPAAADREAIPAPHRDRRDGEQPSGADDAPAGGVGGRDGGAESPRSDALGGPDEHLQGPGRGDSDGGAYSQLSFFLSEAEQIRIIDEAENVKTSSAFSFAQADIDHVLRLGGNTYRQRERIVAAFEEQKSTTEIADTLKTLYHGGNGIGSITAWYAEDGIHLSHGKTARYDKSAQVISWESAAERIGQLLQDGQFATNVELAEAAGYPKADITVAGFETTDRRDFYDLAIGNVPFGQYQVRDKAYDKLNFSIHNYFFAKALDQVRPGGVVAFVTSRYTMDAKDSTVRRYLAQRAELLGAIRLPNNAFKANAGTEVVSDIIFLQKRDRPLDIVPEWTQTGQTEDGFSINRYFLDHPEMVLGRQEPESTAHGMDYTVNPIEGLELADQLHDAVKYIRGTYQEAELPELGEGEAIDTSIPADPNVKNYSYTVVDGDVYYRENSCMVRPDLNATAEARVKGLVGLRECVQQLIDLQMDAATPDSAIQDKQAQLNRLYDDFSAKYGLINDRANRLAFADDSSYYLLCALEIVDEDGRLERKADMFTTRTIKPHEAVTSVDTASEALAISIAEKARVDMEYMEQLTGKTSDELASELQGVIFRLPGAVPEGERPTYVTADEYLSGNVRRKLRQAQRAAQQDPAFAINVEALTAAQPKDLDASEIEVRLGATWIDKEYIQQFMYETFNTP